LAVALAVAIPALIELSRAARSVEKLADTLRRELPPTLEAMRQASLELTDLSDDISGGVQSAGNLAQQMDESLSTARQQARVVQVNTVSLVTGVKAAWQSWVGSSQRRSYQRRDNRRSAEDIEEKTRALPSEIQSRYAEYLAYETEVEIDPNPSAASLPPQSQRNSAASLNTQDE
jgi:hypothetical protein